jgi:D-3-phosphoglycerate dehydrogenase / 2-oxoglutarate reductase
MDVLRALVTAEFSADGLAELRALGYETRHAGWGVTRRPMDRDELIAALRGVDVLICELETVDGAVLSAASTLKVVASCRGDPTNVDLDAAAAHGVIVLCTPGRNARSVADYTLGLLLNHVRRIGRAEAHLRERGWLVDGDLPYCHFRGPELDGRTMGLVGLGAIGRLVAARARGFGMSVFAFDPFVTDGQPGVELVSLDELLARSDVVSLHCPLTPQTRGLIGHRELGLMRSDAILVNTARAAIVDEAALLAALRSRSIGGAALDVFWEEPLAPDHAIRDLDNVTITPHVAGASDDVKRHHARMVLDDLARWGRGEPLAHAVVRPQARTR